MATKKITKKKRVVTRPKKAAPGAIRDWTKKPITRIAGRAEVTRAITLDTTLPNKLQSEYLRAILNHVGDVSLVNGVLILI